MEKFIDLHNHSTASDGTLPPSQLVSMAKAQNLAAIAITDHDTVAGAAEALAAGQQYNIEVVAGVEISVDAISPDGLPISLHLLGYFIDHENQELKQALDRRQNDREARNQQMLHKLNELGVHLTMEQVKEFQASNGSLGRPHFAQAMVRYGWVKDTDQAFRNYLARGAAAYVHKRRLSQKEGIGLIRRAGGVAALAHPAHLLQHNVYFNGLLHGLKSYGLQAVETYYGEYTPQQTQYLINVARKFGLATCGGSDFHGQAKPGLKMGSGRGQLKVPYSCLQELKQKLASRAPQKSAPPHRPTG